MPPKTTPKITLKDIAREANVSVGLTSKALAGYSEVSEATQQRIRKISKRLGYRPPKRRMDQSQTAGAAPRLRRVCLLFLDSRNSDTAYARHWVRELSQTSRRKDVRMEVVIANPDEDDPLWSGELNWYAEDVDGLLIFGFVPGRIGKVIRGLGKPCVAIGDFEQGLRPVNHQVNIDKREMGRAATQALLDAGHRRIGFVAKKARAGSWSDQWLMGYRLALLQAGIADDPAIRPLFDVSDNSALGVQAASHMTAVDSPPTAYVVPGVSFAIHFRHAMAEHGVSIDPHQMAVGGDPEEAAESGLSDYPLFSEDVPSVATHALSLLQQLARREAVPSAQTMIPCQVHNLDRLLRKDVPCSE